MTYTQMHTEGDCLIAALEQRLLRDVAALYRERNLPGIQQLFSEVLRDSIHDSKTGLLNSRGFRDILRLVVVPMLQREHLEDGERRQTADRRSRRTPVSVAYMDIDHLKEINTQVGHDRADIVIAKVANCFKETFRVSDILARVGGDEFIAVLPGAPKEAVDGHFFAIREKLLQHNFGFVDEDGQPIPMSVTFTWHVEVVHPHEDIEQVIKDALMRADAELMKRKERRALSKDS